MNNIFSYFVLAIFSFGFPFSILAQNTPKSITTKFITDEINIDRNLDEPVWQLAEEADNFWQYFPNDSILYQNPTTVKAFYDEHTLYFGFYAESTNGDYVVSTLERDFGTTTNDNLSLLFDIFNDGNNVFFFGVTLNQRSNLGINSRLQWRYAPHSDLYLVCNDTI